MAREAKDCLDCRYLCVQSEERNGDWSAVEGADTIADSQTAREAREKVGCRNELNPSGVEDPGNRKTHRNASLFMQSSSRSFSKVSCLKADLIQ